MDTQPRAEDDFLPSHESQPEEHVVTDRDAAVAEALAAADEAFEINTDETAVETPTDEPASETGQDIELSAEELQDDWQIEIETVEEAVPLELAAEELALEELTFEDPTPSAEAEASAAAVEKAAAETSDATTFVSESEFETLVDEALEAVGGILLFKMRIDDDGEDKHIAAASFGDGARRQFLLLSLPVAGGKLRVESASRSKNPLAKLAEAYVGVVEAFRSAA